MIAGKDYRYSKNICLDDYSAYVLLVDDARKRKRKPVIEEDGAIFHRGVALYLFNGWETL